MYRCIFNHLYVIGPKASEFGEITQTTRPLPRSRSFKVTDFGTNRNPICEFLLVINSNLPPILHRFQVVIDYWSNFRYRHGCASLQRPRCGWFHANIIISFTSSETRRIVLPDAENCTIVSSFIWTQYRNVMDGRTNGRTESLWLLQRSALWAECGRAVKILSDIWPIYPLKF